MKTLIDILKENLPAGAEIQNEKETSNRFKYDFCFDTKSVHGEISKAVAPGYEKSYVLRTIATHMVQLHLGAGEIQQARHWLELSRQGTITSGSNAD